MRCIVLRNLTTCLGRSGSSLCWECVALPSTALLLICTMHTDCHSQVLRQLLQLLLLRCTSPSNVHEENQCCDNVACKFFKSSHVQEHLRSGLENSLMNAIPALLNDVLGGENMQFTDCSALFRRIEACRASYAQFPGGNGLPTCRHAYNTEEMREGSCSSDPENSGVLRWRRQ